MSRKGLIESFNYLREHATTEYQREVGIIDENTSIEVFTAPLLNSPRLFNEFAGNLIQWIVYQQYFNKRITNPLKVLEGESLPIGYAGQEIFTNAAIGRDYDADDFAGLLKKYEADVKVQYQGINFDKQYPVTIIRSKLKQAMSSWVALEEYVTSLTTSLYNGARIDEYNNTKGIVTRAYLSNAVQIEQINLPTNQASAKAFTELARTIFLNFQTPSHEYNAWTKIGGYGRFIETMVDKKDIVMLLRNDIQAKLDVEVLASAMNMDKADLLGRILPVNNFDVIDRKTGQKLLDGSNILGIIADKSWFRIKTQDEYMDEGKNANNRSINYYLNLTKMFNYSFFANAVVLATALPQTPITSMKFIDENGKDVTSTGVSVEEGHTLDLFIQTDPYQANYPASITYASSDATVFTAARDANNMRKVTITGVAADTGERLTATAGNVTVSIPVTVTSAT